MEPDNSPLSEQKWQFTDIVAGLLRLLHVQREQANFQREQAAAIELQQQAIETWGKRLQAIEKQVAEILRVLQRPGTHDTGSVN